MTFASTTAARSISAAVVAVVVASSSVAFAQGRDPVAAEAAFAEARGLMQKGRFDEACPKLEASLSLDPALGTLLNLGDCYEKVGKTASAWLRYREAAALALEKGQREREGIARSRITALEPKLCRLTVRVAEQPEITVTRDGTGVLRAAYGIPVPVDPGSHVVEARGASGAPFSTNVDVKAPPPNGACAVTTVDIPVLGEGGPAVGLAAKPVLRPIDLGPEPPPAALSSESRWRTVHTLALVSAGLGIVGLGVGTAFGLSASGTKSEADSFCIPAGCTADGKALLADAGSAADVSTVFFSVGAVMLVTGAVLWLTSPSLH